MEERSIFDSLAPVDYRYWNEGIAAHLSEAAFLRYKLDVEVALVAELAHRRFCSGNVLVEVANACKQVTCEEVYAEEAKTKHDIRALVNCIQKRVSEEAKPFVHMTATSYDIIETANALRYRKAVNLVILPELQKLYVILMDMSLREADTVQIGRTHGQHAVPITFGFAMAGYVSRLGDHIQKLKECAHGLRGKFSGAVGAYNASSLMFDDPQQFEAGVLLRLGIEPAEHSTQIVPPEPLARLLSEVVVGAGILANLARDMRSLQRTEIGEVAESFGATQVGSSTMPHKRNPINFENVESLWKVLMGRMVTVYMDQVSEHQRDLTGSASSRTYVEIIAYMGEMVTRLNRTMSKLVVDRESVARNLAMTHGSFAAEPLYIILAKYGHPDAHEKVRLLTLQAGERSVPLAKAVEEDTELAPYLTKMSPAERDIIQHPERYTGVASEKARQIVENWR